MLLSRVQDTIVPAATLAVSFVKEIILEGRMLEPVNLAFHTVLFAMSLLGMRARREGVHRSLALCGAAGIGAYIALLFARFTAGVRPEMVRHSRTGGNPWSGAKWIPVFAGMTRANAISGWWRSSRGGSLLHPQSGAR